MTATATGHLSRAGPRRALPRSCRPAQDETTGSYLLRLAAANRITGTDLISYLTASASPSIADVSLTAIAVVSAHPPLALAYALPELRAQHPGHQAMALRGRTLPSPPNTVRPACRRCAARHGAERIDIWYRHEQNICLAHLLWTGPGANHPRDQPDLAACPDIVHAQVRHLRMIHRYGRGAVHWTYSAARLTWDALTYRGRGLPHVVRDIPLPEGFGHQDWPIRPQDPVHEAASYPEVVTLTGLLASPHWRPFAGSAFVADHDRFRAELQRRLPPAFRALAGADLRFLQTASDTAVSPAHKPLPETSL